MALSSGTRLGSYEIQSPLDLTDVNADGQVEVILEGDAY